MHEVSKSQKLETLATQCLQIWMDGKILSQQGMLLRALLPLGDGSYKDQAFVSYTADPSKKNPCHCTKLTHGRCR